MSPDAKKLTRQNRFLIVGGGECEVEVLSKKAIGRQIIACDHGLDYCRQGGVVPDLIIGDLDSASAANLDFFRDRQVKIMKFPTDKDATDLELGLQHALDHQARDIIIMGAAGGRLDQTLANVGLLLLAARAGVDTILESAGGSAAVVLKKRTFSVLPGQVVSVLPIFGETRVTLSGLKYPLTQKKIAFPSTLTISNVALEKNIVVETAPMPVLVVFPLE